MSLFQARDYWSHKPDRTEECDRGCLSISNALLENNNNYLIITGSYQGYIRIYSPKQSGYTLEDLILEINLDFPILQIECGRFTANNPNRHSIAILHPKKIIVYNLNTANNEASHYTLTKQYEHRFENNFSGYNFCYGPFGGQYNRDFLCIQSLQGCLAIYEHDLPVFKRYLPHFLVPGALCYVPKIDSFITASSAMEVECYKYQAFTNNINNSPTNAIDSKTNEVKRDANSSLQIDWSVNIGEHVIDLFVARYSRSLAASQIDILVLTEKSLFTLKESGAIRLQKRLDYNPSTAYCYTLASEEDVGGSNQNLIIATQQSSIMIYRDTQLIWAATTQNTIRIPIAVRVCTFNNIKGFLVLLNDSCEVCICYLGTEPPNNSVANSETRELDYENMDQEHRKLLKIIKQANTDTLIEPKDKLNMKAILPQTLNDPGLYNENDFIDMNHENNDNNNTDYDPITLVKDNNNNIISCTLKLTLNYTGGIGIEKISISIDCCESFQIKKRNIYIDKMQNNSGNNTPMIIDILVALNKGYLLSNSSVTVLAAYVTENGEPRTSKLMFQMPVILSMQPIVPSKNAQYMLTLDTNKPPPNSLATLFPEYFDNPNVNTKWNQEIIRTNASVITVNYNSSNADCTCLLSKKTGRYRIQSGQFEALAALTQQIIIRLHSYYEKLDKANSSNKESKSESLKIGFSESLPLGDYFTIIDKHFAARQSQNNLRVELEHAAQQYRAIQKRLLQRYKDKNPAPLNNLDLLLTETYNLINNLSNQMVLVKNNLIKLSNSLEASTNLINMLATANFNLDQDNSSALAGILSNSINDSLNQSWEDRVDIACTYALKTSLSKNAGSSKAASIDSGFNISGAEPLKDTSKLKRHIQLVMDRLGKGLRLVVKESIKPPINTSNNSTSTANSTSQLTTKDPNNTNNNDNNSKTSTSLRKHDTLAT